MAKRIVFALAVVAFLQCLFVVCLVSALQLQVPRNMPFGATGASPVVTAVESEVSLNTRLYSSESAARDAIGQGKIYGAYISGDGSDTLLTSGQRSFFALTELEPLFEEAARDNNRELAIQDVEPLPKSDPIGAVVGLLLLPTLVGGLLAAILLFKATGSAAQPWRGAALVGYAVVGAFITDLVAGPLLGAYSNRHFWPLLPCFILVTAATALFAAGMQAVLKSVGVLLVVILLIFVGGASSGGGGSSLLPTYWQNIGAFLPPRYAIDLYRSTLYFGGHDITTPIIVLAVYALIGLVLIFPGSYLGTRLAKSAAVDRPTSAESVDPAEPAPALVRQSDGPAPNPAGPDGPARQPGPSNTVRILAALAIVAFMQFLFSMNYMSSGHQPEATNLPLGTTASSPLLTAVQQNGFSIKVTEYADEDAAKTAIAQTKVWGVLIPGTTSNTLIVVPSSSDLAPIDLALQFERAAKSQNAVLNVEQYAPTPLAPKDPFGIVQSLMLVPLLIGGYMSANMLRTATGTSTARWRGLVIAAYAIVAGLLVNLIVGPWLHGYPTDKFWIVWPILSLIIFTIAMIASVLGRLLGAAGTLVTIIVIILFGNPSNGGATGVPYLPGFWRDIGPYLPPRNAYLLLHRTIYFSGNGTTQALIVLLAYAVVFTAILGVLDWYRTRTPEIPVTPETENEAAAMAVPVGAAP